MTDSRHLTEHQISASVDGVLQGASQEQVVRHLADCAECRARYEELVEHHQTLAALLAHEADDSFFAALEADVERALGAGDVLPRGAVVSIKSGPSKPLGPTTPRPTMADSLGAIGGPPAWAPPGGVTPTREAAGPPAPVVPVANAAPVARVIPLPVTPPAATPPPRIVPRAAVPPEPEPLHVFPDELDEDEAEDAALEQAATPPRGRGSVAILSYALATVAVIAVATLAVMLLRRGDDAAPVTGSPTRAATATAPATATEAEPAAPERASVEPLSPPPAPTITRIAPPDREAPPTPAATAATPSRGAAPEPARTTTPVKPRPAPAQPEPKPAPAAATSAPAARAATPRATETPRPANGPVRMCGVVRDANGNPVARAQVLVAGLTLGAITSESGTFCLTVPAGDHELRVSALGHAAGTHAVTVAPGMGEVSVTLRAGEATP